ncbi:hypothetical protein [Aquirufa ecclesiirivi]|uniref:hypothetical protein n=1 Tax=Aquirufa ecclesiirivi TaxID=2715124 RepID=UPI0022A826BB|nr:hypothetical protein [Aquirufa ecclesiirivi]
MKKNKPALYRFIISLGFSFFEKKETKKLLFFVVQPRRIPLCGTVIHFAIAYIFDADAHRPC